jgi:hypothetical protein
MADNVRLNPGASGDLIRTVDKSGTETPVSIIDIGGGGSETLLSASAPLPAYIADAGTPAQRLGVDASGRITVLGSGSFTVANSGTFAVQAAQSGSWTVTANAGSGTFAVSDGGGSLTVDAPVGTPVFVRLSDGSSAISTLPVSLASVPSHAVTNAGTFAVQESGAALTALQLIDNLVLLEDAEHSSGDPGVQALAVRRDSGSSLAGADGDYAPLQLDASGNLRVNVAAGGAGDGAILDGASASIKATVFDYTSANPLAVRLSDTNGDYVAAGAGTQYTEDDAAAANPVGGAVIMVRADTLAGVTSADGDNVAARGTDKGELYVKHVDAIPVTDNGGSLTIDGTITANAGMNLNTSALALESGGNLATIAGAVSGSEVQVDIVAALPAGTNNIGDVDVLSVVPGTGATNLGKAEDAEHASGDVGVMALTVRQDTAAALGGTDADYQPLITDASGRLHVAVGNTVTVSGTVTANAGTGTLAVSAASLPLPAGAATAANQSTLIGHVDGIEGLLTTIDADTGTLAGAVSGSEMQVDVVTQPARAATTDTITAKLATDRIQDGTTALTPKFAVITASSSGATEVVAAVTSKKIRVLRFSLSANGNVNVKFQSDNTPTDLTGLFYLTQYGGAGAAFCPVGLFETVAGEALDINLSAAVAVGGVLTYVEV